MFLLVALSVRKVSIVALWVVIGAAAPVFFAIRTFTVPGGAFGPALIGKIDSQTTVSYDGHRIEVSIGTPVAQPGAQWTDARRGDKPNLVVPVTIHRLDSGGDQLEIESWDWQLQPPGGAAVIEGDLVNSYIEGDVDGQPTDDSTSQLDTGETYTGVVAFEGARSSGTISLDDPNTQRAVVTWAVSATPAVTVAAALGTAARGQIGAPEFTASASAPKWVRSGDGSLARKPRSGTYLVVDFTFTGDHESDQSLAAANLAFLPKGSSTAVPADGSAVADGLFTAAASSADVLSGPVGFDARKGPGTLELLDDAGRAVVTWAVPG